MKEKIDKLNQLKPGFHLFDPDTNEIISYEGENKEKIVNMMYLDSITKRINEGTNVDECNLSGFYVFYKKFTVMFYCPFKDNEKNGKGVAFFISEENNRLKFQYIDNGLDQIKRDYQGMFNMKLNLWSLSNYQKTTAKNLVKLLVAECQNAINNPDHTLN